jgi:phosphotransferase system enzyme I (PtsI)
MAGSDLDREIRLAGVPVSEGVVLARVRFMERKREESAVGHTIPAGRVEAEIERLRGAIDETAGQFDALIEKVTQRLGTAQANIFVAQKMMVMDEVLRAQCVEVIRTGRINAEAAVVRTLNAYEATLKEVDNEYLKERATDIGEIRRRLVATLTLHPESQEDDRSPNPAPGVLCILVAEELTPAETMALDTDHTVGFITEHGGPASHAGILARALGIPAVSGLGNAETLFTAGQVVLLNGTTGDVILNPNASTVRLYPAAKRTGRRLLTAVSPVDGLTVYANINLAAEAGLADRVEAEGIGLYRTEFEMLAAGRILSEDEQYEIYTMLLKAMAGKPVHFRLLDLGGDKAAPFLDLPNEENPILGFRGARFLLGHSELFMPQARALVRASAHGRIRVLYPMIADLKQFLKLRELFFQHTQDLPSGDIQHGVMFEVPSACLAAREFFEVADFGSIGSNDLVQYLFAVDRNNERVSVDYSPDHPVFWRLLRDMVDAARDAGKPLCLCGEIGGQPRHLPKLMELGLSTVSVTPRLVGLARLAARRVLFGLKDDGQKK